MPRSPKIDPVVEYPMVAYVGKQLSVSFELLDADDNVVALTGYTAAGKVTDEDGATIITLTPTVTAATGLISLDQTLSAALTPGRYEWKMELIVGGNEHVRFRGPFELLAY